MPKTTNICTREQARTRPWIPRGPRKAGQPFKSFAAATCRLARSSCTVVELQPVDCDSDVHKLISGINYFSYVTTYIKLVNTTATHICSMS
jgi:hypothetical protein